MPDTGAPLFFPLEPDGTINWGPTVNAGFTNLNTLIAALQAGGTTGPAGPAGAAGAVGIIWAGPWASGTPYVATDAVSFNGSSYLALASSTGVQPDTHPSTWAILALGGATGPVGPQGPVGPAGPGGGTTVTFPIAVNQGGTGAIDPTDARANLAAAASGLNTDITQLRGLVASSGAGPSAVSVTGPAGAAGGAFTVSNGTNSGGITVDGGFFAEYIQCAGQIICGPLICAGRFQVSEIGEGVSGAGVNVDNVTRFANGLILLGSAPVATSGQVALGGGTASTASAGGGQAMPSTVLGYLLGNAGGVIIKIPFLAN